MFELRYIGGLHVFLGEYKLAANELELAKKAFITLQDDSGLGRTFEYMGDLAYHQGRLVQAMNMYKKAKEKHIVERDTRRMGLGYIINKIGRVEKDLGNLETALACQKEAMKLFDGVKDNLGRAHAFLELGDLYRLKRDVSEAMKHYELAMPLYNEEKNKFGPARVYRGMAILWSDSKPIEEIMELYDYAERLFIEVKAKSELAKTYYSRGGLYWRRSGSSEKALYYFDKANYIFRKFKEKYNQSMVNRALAEVHATLNNSEEASKFFKKAVHLQKEWEAELSGKENC